MKRLVQIAIAVILVIVVFYFFSRWAGYGVYNSDIQQAQAQTSPASSSSSTTARLTGTVKPAVVSSEAAPSTNFQETTLDLMRWKSVQQERRANMDRECEYFNLKSRMLTQRGTPARHILVNDKYKLMYCFIPKVSGIVQVKVL